MTLAAAVAFGVSLYILPLYTGGDQQYYRQVYEYMPGRSFLEARRYFISWTAAREPVYPIFAYAFSPFVSKVIFSSGINAALTAVAALNVATRRVPLLVAVGGASTLYWLVLLFSAERLGLAFVFLGLAGLVRGRWRVAFVLMSVATHGSMVFFAGVLLAPHAQRLFGSKAHEMTAGKRVQFVVVLATCVAGVSVTVGEALSVKYAGYSASSTLSWFDLATGAYLFALAVVWGNRSRLEVCAGYAPILAGGFLIGGGRLLMFAFALLVYYGANDQRIRLFGLYPASVYLALSGWTYLELIVEVGDGFAVR